MQINYVENIIKNGIYPAHLGPRLRRVAFLLSPLPRPEAKFYINES